MAIKFESNGHFWPDTELNRIKSLVALFRCEPRLRKIQDTPTSRPAHTIPLSADVLSYRTTTRAAIPFVSRLNRSTVLLAAGASRGAFALMQRRYADPPFSKPAVCLAGGRYRILCMFAYLNHIDRRLQEIPLAAKGRENGSDTLSPHLRRPPDPNSSSAKELDSEARKGRYAADGPTPANPCFSSNPHLLSLSNNRSGRRCKAAIGNDAGSEASDSQRWLNVYLERRLASFLLREGLYLLPRYLIAASVVFATPPLYCAGQAATRHGAEISIIRTNISLERIDDLCSKSQAQKLSMILGEVRSAAQSKTSAQKDLFRARIRA